jgi:hypothetical protein
MVSNDRWNLKLAIVLSWKDTGKGGWKEVQLLLFFSLLSDNGLSQNTLSSFLFKGSEGCQVLHVCSGPVERNFAAPLPLLWIGFPKIPGGSPLQTAHLFPGMLGIWGTITLGNHLLELRKKDHPCPPSTWRFLLLQDSSLGSTKD